MIDEQGNQLGIMPTGQALVEANNRGLDLIEVAAKADPPVCRITDLGKFKYEQTKRQREARKHQHANKLKEIKLRLNIDDHDYQTKLNRMKEFLGEGHKVKVSVFFRGRENARPEYGNALLARVAEDIAGIGRPENQPRKVGRGMNMLVAPAKGGPKKTD